MKELRILLKSKTDGQESKQRHLEGRNLVKYSTIPYLLGLREPY